MKKIILILISLTAPLTFASHDDLLFDGAAHKIGFNIGFGSQRVRNASLGVNYTYDVTFYQLQYYRGLKQRSTGVLIFNNLNITKLALFNMLGYHFN